MTKEETRAHQDTDLGLICRWQILKASGASISSVFVSAALQVKAAATASQPSARPDLDPDQVTNQSWSCSICHI